MVRRDAASWCAEHPRAAVRRFLADGELGRGLYAFCVPADDVMHALGPVQAPPGPDAAEAFETEAGPRGSQQDDDTERLFATLSPPEVDVLAAAARGLTVSETGVELHKSPQTVKSQRNAVILKLGARNMTHAVCMAAELGLVHAR
jgi:DNA-binding CsgD family transcriptional regulator